MQKEPAFKGSLEQYSSMTSSVVLARFVDNPMPFGAFADAGVTSVDTMKQHMTAFIALYNIKRGIDGMYLCTPVCMPIHTSLEYDWSEPKDEQHQILVEIPEENAETEEVSGCIILYNDIQYHTILRRRSDFVLKS